MSNNSTYKKFYKEYDKINDYNKEIKKSTSIFGGGSTSTYISITLGIFSIIIAIFYYIYSVYYSANDNRVTIINGPKQGNAILFTRDVNILYSAKKSGEIIIVVKYPSVGMTFQVKNESNDAIFLKAGSGAKLKPKNNPDMLMISPGLTSEWIEIDNNGTFIRLT